MVGGVGTFDWLLVFARKSLMSGRKSPMRWSFVIVLVMQSYIYSTRKAIRYLYEEYSLFSIVKKFAVFGKHCVDYLKRKITA